MKQDAGFRQWFEHCFSITAGEIDLERKEDYLTEHLKWIAAAAPPFVRGLIRESHGGSTQRMRRTAIRSWRRNSTPQ